MSYQIQGKVADAKGNHIKSQYQIGFDWLGPGQKYAVHETIAIAAFMRSVMAFPEGTTYDNLSSEQWEYFRGIIWNDDPSCLLFKSSKDNNRLWGAGLEFYHAFMSGKRNCMTQRSHFGDLQCLHAMGTSEGEPPHYTLDRVLKWLEIMYKLACGDQGVSEDDELQEHLPNFFNSSTDPMGIETLKDLLVATTPEYQRSRISARALGCCLHIIQDSYAMGHVQRRLRNYDDVDYKDSQGRLFFKEGTWAKWGAIYRFHTYTGQDTHIHDIYDGPEGARLPDPRNLESFNRLSGTRDAIDASISLINAVVAKMPWAQLCNELKKTTLALDPDAQDCNTDVDHDLVKEERQETWMSCSDDKEDLESRLSTKAKVLSLESGSPTQQHHLHSTRLTTALYILITLILMAGFTVYTVC